VNGEPPVESFACGLAARWLPRVLAGSLLVAALLAAERLQLAESVPQARAIRYGVVLIGALLALGTVRRGAEVRQVVEIGGQSVVFRERGRERELRFDEIDRWVWAPPFSRSRFWLPAAMLVDRSGRAWRLPALLGNGGRLIALLVRRAGRHDLEVWAETLRLPTRMGRPRVVAASGYGIALLALAIGLALRFG